METSTIVYDLDTSGGLMEQIQTLLASPKSEDGGKRSRKTQKEQRRGGRSTNHDTCDSCREGGDLLCCDHCPAAFHLQCCNPPLNEDMLPSADWMCHRCLARRKKRELRRERLNGLLDQPSVKQSPPSPEVELSAVRLEGAAGAGPPAAVAQVRLVERPATPASSTSTDTATPTPSEQNDADDDDLLDVEDEAQGLGSSSGSDGTGGEYLRKPFALLIAAAMEMNPSQFQLPSDLTCTAALPGTGKRRRKELPVLKSMKRRQQHDLDPNAPVPLPVKLCFSCGRSCRLAPLIQCDFCPLLFHMECTEPSLLAMPMGTWMCPKHRERLALSQGNVGLGSRCQLFDQFRDQVSQHAIKLDFLQLMRCPDWPSTKESDPPTRKALKVPKAVKLQYQCPQTLAAPEGIRIGELIRNGIPEQHYSSPFSSPCSTSSFTQHFTTSQAEQREWLEDIIALQCSIVRRFSAKQMPPVLWQCEQAGKANVKPCVTSEEGSSPRPSGRPALLASHSRDPQVEATGRLCPHCGTVGSSLQPASCGCASAVSSMASAAHLRNHTGGAVAAEAKQEDTVTINPCTGHTPTLTTRSQLGQLVRSQPRILETCGVSSPPAGTRALTPPRCPQGNGLTNEKASVGAITPSTESSVPEVSPPSKGPLCSDLERAADSHVDIELTQLDERFIKLLARQRIQQLFQPKTTSGRPRQGPPPQEASSKGQVRAAFYPLTGKGGAVNMCYRTLYIGTGADMDVCLTKYGHCNYVSGKHACIFYDENTKHYELLNYSEHGTTVDNVLYSCDFSEKSSHRPSGCATNRAQSLIGHCRKRKQQEEEDEDEEQGLAGGVMSSRAGGGAAVRCACRASSSSLIGGSGAGWEGTALLHHGSCIKLGCLQFVFSVAHFTHGLPKQEEPQEEARTKPQERGEEARTEPDVRQPLVLLQSPVLCSSVVP